MPCCHIIVLILALTAPKLNILIGSPHNWSYFWILTSTPTFTCYLWGNHGNGKPQRRNQSVCFLSTSQPSGAETRLDCLVFMSHTTKYAADFSDVKMLLYQHSALKDLWDVEKLIQSAGQWNGVSDVLLTSPLSSSLASHRNCSACIFWCKAVSLSFGT